MRNAAVQLIALLLCWLPGIGQSEVVLKGKTSSMVTAVVTRTNNLFVTDEGGGWYENGLIMVQMGGLGSAYEVEAPLRITSTSGKFHVRIDSSLVLQHVSKPALVFRNVVVKMGPRGEALKLLAVAQNTTFTNPAASANGDDSIGHYLLTVSALPPSGDFKSTGGNYTGVLSLTFEPVLE